LNFGAYLELEIFEFGVFVVILFFFGEDAFRIREKRLALKKLFFEKNPGSAGFFEFDFSDGAEVSALSACLAQAGLFDAKKFVIAGNIFDAPIETRRALAEFLEKNAVAISSDENRILLLFQNGQPKKNEKLWKALSAKAIKTQEFLPLVGAALSKWMDESTRRWGALGIDLPAKKLLLEICRTEAKKQGEKRMTDMFQLESELRKLAAYRTGDMIREEDARLLSPPAIGEETVFQALDLLFAGRRNEALLLFARLMKGGGALGLLGMCAWQLRNIIRAKGALNDGEVRNAMDAARLLGMHPFAAGKCFDIATRSSFESLERAFTHLARLDREAKSGDRDPEEALTAFVMGE
jgi:DNA polymerase III delta subunit